MNLQAITFKASQKSIATIDEFAESRQVDRAKILRDALAMYLADLEEADRQIEAGDFVTYEDIVARYKTRTHKERAT